MTTVEINEENDNAADATAAAAAAAVAAGAAAQAVTTLAEVAQSEATAGVVAEAVQDALTMERIGQDMMRMNTRIYEMEGKLDQIAAATVASQQVVQAVAAEVEAVLDAPPEPVAEAVEETPPPAQEAPVKKSKWV